MGPGETIGLVAVSGALIAILIVLGEGFKRFIAFREKRLELMADKTAEKAAQYAAQVERLEARMRACSSGSRPTRAFSSPTRSKICATSS